MESRLKDGKNLVTDEQYRTLETELNAVLLEFEPLVKAISDSAPEDQTEPLDAQSAKELLEKLESMLEMGNTECRGLIGDLRRIQGSEGLIQQIDDLDFEQAVITLAELRKKLK